MIVVEEEEEKRSTEGLQEEMFFDKLTE